MKKFKVVLTLLLCLLLAACNNKTDKVETEKPKEENTKQEEVVKEEKKEEQKEEIDEASGLKVEGKLNLKFSKSYKVDFLEKGVKKYTDVEGREVYFLPEGMELDNKDLITLKIPVERIAIFSTVDATFLRPIDKLDTIVATTTKAGSWRIPEVKERVENGEITYLGSKSELNNEELQRVNPDVILFTYENLERTPILIQTFNDLELNWLGFSPHMESDPRARIEWVKLAGILTGELDKATQYYDKQLETIAEVEKMTAEEKGDKPTFAWTFLFKDLFYTKKAGDYSVKTAELAGSKTIFADLEPENDGNAKLNAEEFYKGAENADFLIIDTISSTGIEKVSDLIEYADYMGDLKAVKDNRVWGLKPNYYQSADFTADMIKELYDIFHDEEGKITETEYFYNMGIDEK